MAITENLTTIARAVSPMYWACFILCLALTPLILNRYKRGLYGIPGPFWASFSNLWLLNNCANGKSTEEWKLHRKYNSKLVRLGPSTVSVSDPEAIRIIYGYKPIFLKGDLYSAQQQVNKDGDIYHTISSTVDEKIHASIKRPIAHAYALGTLVGYEPLIDSTFETFVKEITVRFAESGKECPLATWLQMYAFDVIGELTFSKRLGFLESGTDLGNMMYHTSMMIKYVSLMGQVSWVDLYLRIKNPIWRKMRKYPVVQFTLNQIRDHVQSPYRKPDFLTQFIEAQDKYADIMTEDRIADMANSNVAAGSDTTAIILRELVFQILTHKSIYDKVMQEIKAVLDRRSRDNDFEHPITWQEGSKMVYYQACIKECLRYHPALGQILPRVVPEGGVEICGRFLPGGTTVGCNAYTIHRDKDLYGKDADEFRPERWIEGDPNQIRKMETLNFWFGAGPRVCIGKNIAMLELTKFIPEFFRRFEVNIVDPNRYTNHNIGGWVAPQIGLDAKIKLRDQAWWLGSC